MIQFFAEGIPKGQPRPKAFAFHGKARVYDPGTAEHWKGQVALAARDHRPEKPITGPLRVILGFRFPRPKSHFRTGKNAGQLRADASPYHTGKPDSDNCAKAVLDALSHLGIWQDDAQVAILKVWKMYQAGPVGCYVTIEPIQNDDTPHDLPQPGPRGVRL